MSSRQDRQGKLMVSSSLNPTNCSFFLISNGSGGGGGGGGSGAMCDGVFI